MTVHPPYPPFPRGGEQPNPPSQGGENNGPIHRAIALLLLACAACGAGEPAWQLAVEEFERDPLSLRTAQAVLNAYRPEPKTSPAASDSFPTVYYRAARMEMALATRGMQANETALNRLDWSWKFASPEELPGAIEDWLARRIYRGSNAENAIAAGRALFHERGARWQIDEEEIRKSFRIQYSESIPREQHLRDAELLERGGFFENARREYARAAGQLAYASSLSASAPKPLPPEARQRAWQGNVRMLAILGRWEDAERALNFLEEGAEKAALAGLLKARQAPPSLQPPRSWQRLAWEWMPLHARRYWDLRNLVAHPEGILALSDWDATLLDPQTGRARWTWDPKKGAIEWLGLRQGNPYFVIEADRERPSEEGTPFTAGVWPRGQGPKRNFQLATVDIKTGEGGATPYLAAQFFECLSLESVLVRIDKRWEIRWPEKQLKPPGLLEETPLEKQKFCAAGAEIMLFEVRAGKPEPLKSSLQWAAFDQKTGRELWHTTEPVEEILPASAVQAIRQGTQHAIPCGVLGTGSVYQGLARTLVCRELRTGKLRWTYTDPAMSVGAHYSLGWVNAVGPFEVAGKKIVCAIYPETGIAVLDANDGKPLWRLQVRATASGHEIYIPGLTLATAPVTGEQPCFWLACGDFLLALDPLTGRTVWNTPLQRFAVRPEVPPGRMLIPPLIQGARAILLDSRGRTSTVLSVRLEPRPPEISEIEGECWNLAELRKAMESSADAATPARWISLGLANDAEGRAVLRAWVLKNAASCSAWVAAQAGPYGDTEFEQVLLPLLKRFTTNASAEESLALLSLSATEKQKAALDALQASVRQAQPNSLWVRMEESKTAAAKVRDAEKAAERPPPTPEDEF